MNACWLNKLNEKDSYFVKLSNDNGVCPSVVVRCRYSLFCGIWFCSVVIEWYTFKFRLTDDSPDECSTAHSALFYLFGELKRMHKVLKAALVIDSRYCLACVLRMLTTNIPLITTVKVPIFYINKCRCRHWKCFATYFIA